MAWNLGLLGASSPVTVPVEYLVVAGGGGGGGYSGGGAGGLLYNSALNTVVNTNYPVTVGAGGPGGPSATGVRGTNGSNSIFNTSTAIGGGAGAANGTGANGGSGGGGGWQNSAAGTATQTNSGGATGFGNNGGNGFNNGSTIFNGGGGGGAGSAGTGSGSQPNGGAGREYSINGTALFYAGGGGGGSIQAGGTGGSGVGGTGATNNGTATAGAATRGGGGGGGRDNDGAAGGSGTVILKYPEGNYISVGAGLSAITTVSNGFGITQVFSGTGNISFQEPTSGTIPVTYLVVSGGQSGSGFRPGVAWGDGGDGGQVNGGVLFVSPSTNLTCQVGAGGAGVGNGAHSNSGGTSIFSTITSTSRTDSTFTLRGGFGMNGLSEPIATPSNVIHWGGVGVTFEGVGYGGGGSWGNSENPSGYTTGHLFGGGAASEAGGTFFTTTANRGGGGHGARNNGATSQSGGSGVVILKYPDSRIITGGTGLTFNTSSSGGFKITTFTAGTGTIIFS